MTPEQPIDDAPAAQGEAEPNTPEREVSEADEKLLIQIRKDYRFCLDYWRANREEAETDMQYAAANGWTADDLQEREGRPCLWPDELSQYVKQANNNQRQNPTEIVVNPKGDGATDEDALRREAIIRGIQYSSSAQAAYTTAFESAAWCGFGAYRIINEEVDKKKNQQPRIKRIPNAFSVLFDPMAKEADFSDQEICFVGDAIRMSAFPGKFPNAKKTSFESADSALAPDWFKGDAIVVAEYWTAKNPGKPNAEVIQYITNGVEILEKNVWPGWWIPIIGLFGEEIYVVTSGESKRMFMSLIRRARVPQKMLAYIASQEAEEFGMSPRTPFLIWEGQDEADAEAWKDLNKKPRAYVKIKAKLDANGQLLPPPSRQPFIPNADAYQISREAWRRAIQAAMGLADLPTPAQKQNEKSGIALEKIENQQAVGSYHLIDNANRSKENCGRQLNQLITVLFDTPRQVPTRQADDEHKLIHVLQTGQDLPEGADTDDYLISDRGEFDVTYSEGPSRQSQREAQDDFLDKLIEELAPLAQVLPPGVIPKIIAAAIKARNLGAEVDKLAELLDPPETGQPNPAAMQQQIGVLNAQLQEAGVLVQKLQMEKQAKVLELQAKAQIEQMKDYSDKEKFAIEQQVKLEIAEITAKVQDATTRMQLLQEIQLELHKSGHELAAQMVGQKHEQAMAQMQGAQQQQLAAQSHQQALEQGAQGHQQALEQQAAQPEPEPAQ